MAQDESKNLTEGQTETSENEDQELEESTQTDDETEAEESTSEESVEESPTSKYDSRLAALEDQLRRSNEDRDTLRETLRLNQQLVEQTRPKATPKQLTDEQKALRDLGLVFGDDIQDATKPLVDTVSRLYDQNDAVQFQLHMSRSHPSLMEGESFDKLSQAVESVRQQYARQTGQYLPRMDAFKYAKGSGLLDTILTPVTKKPVSDSEQRRQSEVKQAGNGIKTVKKRVESGSDSAEIQKIREKAHRGIRLTEKERIKFGNYLADKPF